MEFNDEEKQRIKRFSPFMKLVFDTLMSWVKMLINNKCDEEMIADAASKINASTKGYVRAENQATVDEAMRILGLGQNRQKCIDLLRKNGIRNMKVNNVKVGYPKDKIYALKRKLEGGD